MQYSVTPIYENRIYNLSNVYMIVYHGIVDPKSGKPLFYNLITIRHRLM